MVTAEEVASRYPIHWLVWDNQHEELKNQLQGDKFTVEDLEVKDPRGRTPLLLAVTLGHIESVQVLLDAGADVNCEKDGWTAVQEATVAGDLELLSLVLSRRDKHRHTVRSAGIPELLHKLSLAPDFYVEMKWEFTSWVPLVSRMCPSDTYKVYKRGANVRVDTTLVGFENNKWQRGNRTYIFRGAGRSASLVELDHELGTTWCEYLEPPSDSQEMPTTSHKALMMRLNSPIATTSLDTDNISIERNKSGIWGWRQDKIETVNGYDCKVFSANNVELVSKTRTEHLAKERKRAASPRAPLAGLLALADAEVPETPLLKSDNESSSEASRSSESLNVEPLSWEQYFGTGTLLRDVGRPRDLTTKVQKFRATLCLCEDYPLQLQEQIMPILDLMAAISSPHFAKLKDFVQLQLPAGFPVKIEIPLFHVLNARITFGNIFATHAPVTNVHTINEGDRLSCVIDDACFDIGSDYRDTTEPEDRHLGIDDEEGLLQYAIQQSLMDPGTLEEQVDVWEALRGAPPATPAQLVPAEDTQLQRAIEASLANLSVQQDCLDPELEAALDLSAKEQATRDEQAMMEQKQLQDVLWLSLLDK